MVDGHDALAAVLGAADLDRLRGGLLNGHGLASHLHKTAVVNQQSTDCAIVVQLCSIALAQGRTRVCLRDSLIV